METPGIQDLIDRLYYDSKGTSVALSGSIGKVIDAVSLADDRLRFLFTDGSTLYLWDDKQSCCERRFMSTDDILADYTGATLLDVELRDAPSIDHEWNVHEVQFLAVKTSKGEFVMSSHNEHNGYYGGFAIKASQ